MHTAKLVGEIGLVDAFSCIVIVVLIRCGCDDGSLGIEVRVEVKGRFGYWVLRFSDFAAATVSQALFLFLANSQLRQPFQVLKRSAYFRNQEDEFFSELEPKLIRVEVDHGTDIIGQGSYVQWLIIVEIGRLTKYRKGENGHNFVNLGNVEAGEITGIHHLIHVNHPEECIAYATITSKGPSVVWKLGRDDFQSVLTSKPQFSLSFMCTLSKEMRQGSKILRSLAKLHDGRLRGENGEPSSSTQNIFRVLCYDSSRWVRDNLIPAVKAFNDKYSKEKDVWLHIEFSADTLGEHSVANASGYDAVCLFVNDIANEDIIATLSIMGVRLICMRCTGVDRLDRGAAAAHNLTVCRVPAYSPYAVAEHAIALFMEINRKIHRAITNIAQQVFTLDGLLGMDVHGKTVAVLGTGKIGR